MVIMSRSREKLQSVADEIRKTVDMLDMDMVTSTCVYNGYACLCFSENKYNREVRIVVVDFTDGQEVYPRMAEELKDMDIGILGW